MVTYRDMNRDRQVNRRWIETVSKKKKKKKKLYT